MDITQGSKLIGNTGVTDFEVIACGAALTAACHRLAYQSGWWNDLKTGEDMRGKRNIGELLCLVHSEISEAMEAHRLNSGAMRGFIAQRPLE